MTITEARKILGKDAESMNDAEVAKEIESASLFKNIFFSFVLSDMKEQKSEKDLIIKTVQ